MGLPNIGPLELIIILAIALLIVGPGRLPEMGSAVGRTIREFRKASSDITDAAKVDPMATAKSEPRPNTLSNQATPNEPAAGSASGFSSELAAPAADLAAPAAELADPASVVGEAVTAGATADPGDPR